MTDDEPMLFRIIFCTKNRKSTNELKNSPRAFGFLQNEILNPIKASIDCKINFILFLERFLQVIKQIAIPIRNVRAQQTRMCLTNVFMDRKTSNACLLLEIGWLSTYWNELQDSALSTPAKSTRFEFKKNVVGLMLPCVQKREIIINQLYNLIH